MSVSIYVRIVFEACENILTLPTNLLNRDVNDPAGHKDCLYSRLTELAPPPPLANSGSFFPFHLHHPSVKFWHPSQENPGWHCTRDNLVLQQAQL